MTRAQLLMLAAELCDDAPELGDALEVNGVTSDDGDFEGLLARGLVLPDGDLTREGQIVLQLLIIARGDKVTP